MSRESSVIPIPKKIKKKRTSPQNRSLLTYLYLDGEGGWDKVVDDSRPAKVHLYDIRLCVLKEMLNIV